MMMKLTKEQLSAIDAAFSILLKDFNQEAVNIIKKNLEDGFRGYTFTINVVNTNPDEVSFMMSVFPDISVTDKIVIALLKNEDPKVIQKMWEKNKDWTIEIDNKLFKSKKYTNRECTAMLLHELGHVVCSNSIPERATTILKYELSTKMSTNIKALASNKVFSKIFSLPILDICIADQKRSKSSIKNEVKADKFAKKMGYSDELLSVLNKYIEETKNKKLYTDNEKLSNVTQFGASTLEDFQKRKDKLVKYNLLSLKENCSSPYISSIVDNYYTMLYGDNCPDAHYECKEDMMRDIAYDIQNKYVTEFFLFGGKKLKRIDPNEIDYIDVKIDSIQSNTDKLMIISYIHSKLDIVNYYIEILESPTLSKKYTVPYTLSQLDDIKKRLEYLRVKALKFKIPVQNDHLYIAWPDGYDG